MIKNEVPLRHSDSNVRLANYIIILQHGYNLKRKICNLSEEFSHFGMLRKVSKHVNHGISFSEDMDESKMTNCAHSLYLSNVIFNLPEGINFPLNHLIYFGLFMWYFILAVTA